jgi:transglutaminase-like putative cysteine protease
MMHGDDPAPGGLLSSRHISCDVTFAVTEPAELVLQVMASMSAGPVEDDHFEIRTDGVPPAALHELRDQHGASMHVVRSVPGLLSVHYRARIGSRAAQATADDSEYARQVYLRPSRYCPSDHLIGFAVAEFGTGADTAARISAITEWIFQRTGYVPGSGTVHDSAEHTLLTGVGTCRDFAHLGIALCRATGIPARFAAVYAPGLWPMDFHAVFEAFDEGTWRVHDPTGLAPRQSLVRIVTGRDAADTAFAAVTSGIADLVGVEVSATAQPSLPVDDQSDTVELA